MGTVLDVTAHMVSTLKPIAEKYAQRWAEWKRNALASGYMSQGEVDKLEASLDEQNAKQIYVLRSRKCSCGSPLEEKNGFGHVNVSCSTNGGEHFLVAIDRAYLDEIRSDTK
jgi:hypothetical protein